MRSGGDLRTEMIELPTAIDHAAIATGGETES